MHFLLAEPVDHIISVELFVESLLGPAQLIDQALRDLTECITGTVWTNAADEDLLEMIDGVRDGKFDHAAFAKRIADSDYAAGTAGYHHLFARNAHILVEQTRTALLRAFDHGDRMMEQTSLLIQNDGDSYFLPLSPGQEIVHSSRAAERLHGAFADGVGAVAKALDLLYRLFVYLVREPFGSAELPGKLYFPYNEAGKDYAPYPKGAAEETTDLGLVDLPYALPNLAPGSFFSLRPMRNDLTHNMMSGHIQPSCFIGCGTALVNEIPIRYVQAVAPDIDSDGKPLKHDYVERFFKQQRDAAVLLHDLLEELALTTDHSLRWLANRLDQRLARSRLPRRTG
ncbi:MAG: hypothetical protein GW855_14525 [Erythrobacter sp.]|nr:hypothetical protein [Erythrobacter sp.]